jgi:hypothetical protein
VSELNDGADSAMLELEQRTEIALRHALEHGTPEDDVRLLCFHCGFKFEHINDTKRKD